MPTEINLNFGVSWRLHGAERQILLQKLIMLYIAPQFSVVKGNYPDLFFASKLLNLAEILKETIIKIT